MAFVFRALLNAVDGVFLGACRLNECNYVTHGNYHALNMVLLSKRIMEYIGINPARLRIDFMSSADGRLFVEIMNDFGNQIRNLGPLGEAEGIGEEELRSRLSDVMKLIPYIKMAKQEKLSVRLSNLEEHERLFTIQEVEILFREAPSYYIDPNKCQACMICLRNCPSEAIAGGKDLIHVIDQERCIKCGTCYELCPPRFRAVKKISGEPVPEPIPENERRIERTRKGAGK